MTFADSEEASPFLENRIEFIKRIILITIFVLFIPYFIFAVILMVQYITTETATRTFWESMSFTADFLGLMALIFSLALWIVGVRSLSYEDVVRAAEEGVIHHPDFRRMYEHYRASTSPELPDQPDGVFTQSRILNVSDKLQKSAFLESYQDFRKASELLEDNYVDDAVFRARRGLEFFTKYLVEKNRKPLKYGRRYSLGQSLQLLMKSEIITPDQFDSLREFSHYANRVIHGDWKPEITDANALIIGIMELVDSIIDKLET